MSKCEKCLFHIVDNDMGATHDCCLLKDNIAERVKACDNSENCKKRLTLEEAKKIVEQREEEVTDEQRSAD